MKRLCMFFVGVLLIMLSGCKKDVLYSSDSGKTFTYSVGEQFSIQLPENPTTGYSWRFKTVPESQLVITPMSDYFEESKTNRVGAGGVHTFVWQVVNAGSIEIHGFHMRPWARSKEEPSVSYKIIVE